MVNCENFVYITDPDNARTPELIMATKVQKILVQPINLIFRYLQQRTTVCIWLYENADLRIEGKIVGFDEFMNLVLEDAVEVTTKKAGRRDVGRILLKGDNISLIQAAKTLSEVPSELP